MIYVDGSALVVAGAADPRHVELAPDVTSALLHLADAGLDVALVGAAGDPAPPRTDARLARVTRYAELPERAEGWLVVGQAAACMQARDHPRLKTMLVAPASPSHGQASRACDLEARDLTDAALSIIALEAMDPAGAAADAREARERGQLSNLEPEPDAD
jgi:hypothetical protein